MDYQDIISFSYSGNGPGKLEKAEQLFRESAGFLLAQEEIVTALSRARERVELLDQHMAAMDMGKTCSQCAAIPGGGCCSAYMGHENNDVLQLLMNMLGGVPVRCVRNDEIECCFLAEDGCLLLFKPIFCLNYLCERIGRESSAVDLKMLEEKTGDLLRAQVALEGLLIAALQKEQKV